jgi:phage terminase Nu1 subunit (DNA packaging protein)
MNTVNNLMTQAQFAAHKGVQRSAVSNWKAKGHLVMAEGPDGSPMVDVERTELRLNARLDPARGRPRSATPLAEVAAIAGPAGRSGAAAVADVRADLLKQQLVGQKLKNAREAGELVPLAEYERRAAEFGRMARERMHGAVRGLAERLAAATEPRAIVQLLAAEIDQAFTDLAEQAAGALEVADAEDGAELEG